MNRWGCKGVAAAVAALTALACGGCSGSVDSKARALQPGPVGALYTDAAAADGAPVGVFDRTALLVAYYRSAIHDEKLRSLQRERDAALARGDTRRAAECERQGGDMQETGHRQLAGDAPLTNIAEVLRGDLPGIARESGVGRIVERGAEREGARKIDITARLLEALPPAR